MKTVILLEALYLSISCIFSIGITESSALKNKNYIKHKIIIEFSQFIKKIIKNYYSGSEATFFKISSI